MIHLIYGKDRYLTRDALREIRASLGDDELIETNTATLDGAAVSPGELLAHAQAVPFLASARLVIVEGLLAHIGGARRGRRSTKKPAADDPLAPWQALAQELADPSALPPTTVLVFLEGELDERNAALPIFNEIAQVRRCDQLPASELPEWIRRAAEARGVRLAPRAFAAFSRLTSGDLWMIENELDKLAAYAGGEIVDEDAVARVVSSVREAKVWDLTDAVVAGNEAKALTSMAALLQDGQAAQLLLFMLVRQYRQIAIVKDMRGRRLRDDAIARAAGVPGFRMDAVGGVASRLAWPSIREAYRLLLDADLSVKRGLRDDEAALQLVVHELCALAPRAGGAQSAYRRTPAPSPR